MPKTILTNQLMKKGLILEGGGLRSLFSAGILDSWMQNDIHFDGVIGVSGGALFGCNFKTHQIGRALRYNILLKDDPRYMGLRSLFKTGNIIGAEFAYHVVPTEIDPVDNDAFHNDPTPFYIVATDVETGLPYYHELEALDYEGLEWMRATGSMPLVSTPVPLNGHLYLDGGMTDSLPLRYFQSIGYEGNVVILTRPRGYRKKKTKMTPLFRIFCHKYPKIAETMERRADEYNKQLDYLLEQEKAGNTLLIFPDKALEIGRIELNETKMRAIHQYGVEKGESLIPKIKEFLSH